MIYLTAIV